MAARVTPPPSPEAVAEFLGQGDDEHVVSLARAHLVAVQAFARAYTRDNGFNADGLMADDLYAVILSATARSVHNPESVQREQLADYSVTPTIGWTLVELAVLNRWRKRAK